MSQSSCVLSSFSFFANLSFQPLSAEEAPPTAEEETFIQNAKVVETAQEAEEVAEGAPVHGESQWAEDKRGEVRKGKKKEGEKKKKGWFW